MKERTKQKWKEYLQEGYKNAVSSLIPPGHFLREFALHLRCKSDVLIEFSRWGKIVCAGCCFRGVTKMVYCDAAH